MLCLFSGIPLDDGRTAMLVEVIADESSLRRDLAFSDCSNLALLFSSDGKFISANDAFSSSYGNHLVDLSEFIGDINIAQQWLDNAKKIITSSATVYVGQANVIIGLILKLNGFAIIHNYYYNWLMSLKIKKN